MDAFMSATVMHAHTTVDPTPMPQARNVPESKVGALAFSFSFSRMAVPIASSLRQFSPSANGSAGLEGSLVLVSLLKTSKGPDCQRRPQLPRR